MEGSKKRFSFFEFIGKLVFKIVLFFVLLSALCTVLAKVFGKKLSVHIDFDDIDENAVEGEAKEKDESDETTESEENGAE